MDVLKLLDPYMIPDLANIVLQYTDEWYVHGIQWLFLDHVTFNQKKQLNELIKAKKFYKSFTCYLKTNHLPLFFTYIALYNSDNDTGIWKFKFKDINDDYANDIVFICTSNLNKRKQTFNFETEKDEDNILANHNDEENFITQVNAFTIARSRRRRRQTRRRTRRGTNWPSSLFHPLSGSFLTGTFGQRRRH